MMWIFSKLGIHDKTDLFNLIKQFIKFGIVGVFNTLISLVVYYLLVMLSVHYIAANMVGFVAGVINSYYWNNKYVFQKRESGHAKPFLKVLTVYGFTFLLGTGLLYGMVNYLGVSELIAPLLNLFVTIPLNFLLNKLWAMKS